MSASTTITMMTMRAVPTAAMTMAVQVPCRYKLEPSPARGTRGWPHHFRCGYHPGVDRREARILLALPPVHDSADVEAAFRRLARDTHPDHGGDAERFKVLAESRRVLLSPSPSPKGTVVVVDDGHRLLRLVARVRRFGSRKPPRVI